MKDLGHIIVVQTGVELELLHVTGVCCRITISEGVVMAHLEHSRLLNCNSRQSKQ